MVINGNEGGDGVKKRERSKFVMHLYKNNKNKDGLRNTPYVILANNVH